MKALSKSLEPGNDEFVVHIKDEYDYRFICEKRDELFESIKACYFKIMNKNLPIYGLPANIKLKDYCTAKKEIQKGVEKLPPDNYILKNEDLYEPLNDSTNSSTAMTSSSTFDDELPKLSDHRPTFAKKGDM